MKRRHLKKQFMFVGVLIGVSLVLCFIAKSQIQASSEERSLEYEGVIFPDIPVSLTPSLSTKRTETDSWEYVSKETQTHISRPPLTPGVFRLSRTSYWDSKKNRWGTPNDVVIIRGMGVQKSHIEQWHEMLKKHISSLDQSSKIVPQDFGLFPNEIEKRINFLFARKIPEPLTAAIRRMNSLSIKEFKKAIGLELRDVNDKLLYKYFHCHVDVNNDCVISAYPSADGTNYSIFILQINSGICTNQICKYEEDLLKRITELSNK